MIEANGMVENMEIERYSLVEAPQRDDEWPFPSIWPRKPNAFRASTGPA